MANKAKSHKYIFHLTIQNHDSFLHPVSHLSDLIENDSSLDKQSHHLSAQCTKPQIIIANTFWWITPCLAKNLHCADK